MYVIVMLGLAGHSDLNTIQVKLGQVRGFKQLKNLKLKPHQSSWGLVKGGLNTYH